MKLLIDMNLSPRWTEFLRDAGWEAIHWSSVGRFDATDSEVMSYAGQHGYVVLTHDLDFSTILAATHGSKPSVIQLRTEDLSMQAVGSLLVAAIRHTTAELEAGALLSISSGQTRIRTLPI